MKKPVIGLVPLVDVERDSYWMMPPYFDALEQAGALPLMLPLTGDPDDLAQLTALCDGVLFTGGPDVAPAFYGEEKLPACGLVVPRRDEMELRLFRTALEAGKPVFGICRGIQLINVALGGSLWQDLASQKQMDAAAHEQKPPYDRPCHRVSIVPGSPLAALLGKEETEVTSRHHQAVKELAPGLEAMAYSEEGLVEAVRMPGRPFVWAVQWHPENSCQVSEDSRRLFAAFVDSCKKENGTTV